MNDLISRQAAIDAIAELQGRAYTKAELKGISKAWKRIKQLPSAEPERKKGQWIPGKELSREMLAGQVVNIEYENYRCSACGIPIDRLLYHVDGSPFYKFCPNCGADMREENQE